MPTTAQRVCGSFKFYVHQICRRAARETRTCHETEDHDLLKNDPHELEICYAIRGLIPTQLAVDKTLKALKAH